MGQRKFNPYILIAMVVVMFLSGTLQAQSCCGLGSSMTSGSAIALGKGLFFVRLLGEYGKSGPQFTEDRESLDKTGRSITRQEGRLTAGIGITEQLSADLTTGLLYRAKAYSYESTGMLREVRNSNLGLSDGTVSVRWRFLGKDPFPRHTLIAGVFAGLPWGPSEAYQKGVLLPRELQTGTGGWSAGGLLSAYRSWPERKIGGGLVISQNFRLEGAGRYDYGDEFIAHAYVLSGPWAGFRGVAGLNYRQAGTDRQFDVVVGHWDQISRTFVTALEDRTYASTGGRFLDAVPAVEFRASPVMTLSAEAEIPLWRRVNGTQLTKGYLIRFSTIYSGNPFRKPL